MNHTTDTVHAGSATQAPRAQPRLTRTRGIIALTLTVAVVAGGVFGLNRLLSEDAVSPATDPTSNSPAGPAVVADGPLEVSGAGVGTQAFGTGADEVLASFAARYGEPDLTEGPARYHQIAGQDGWFEDGNDPLSASWQYPVASVSCWGTLCLIFGGDDPDALQLRGWELAQARRWSGFDEIPASQAPDVRLADTGIRLGDSWKSLHAAYPDTVVGGAEGASLAVNNTPWPGVTDGAAGWRLSGEWDWTHPSKAPADAVVTRLSAGEGPEPGCC